MKAEHRKELQTNTLADMLGRTVRKVRATSSIPWVKVLIVVFVAAGVGVFFWLRSNSARNNSQRWVEIDSGTTQDLAKLSGDEYKDTNQSKVARHQLAFDKMWNEGIKMLLVEPKMGLGKIAVAIEEFEKLAQDCKGDPVLEPEALFSVAAGYECLAIADEKYLDEALKKYDELSKHPEYSKGTNAYVLQARKRAAQLADPAQRPNINAFYAEFATRADISKKK